MNETEFSFTWGLEILGDLGYTRVFNFMLRHYIEAGVTVQEMLLLVHLASYHYESAKGESRPSIPRLAQETGWSERHVSRLLKSLEGKGMLEITYRSGRTSIYNARCFSETVYKLWLESQALQVVGTDDDSTTPDMGVRGQESDDSDPRHGSHLPLTPESGEEEKKEHESIEREDKIHANTGRDAVEDHAGNGQLLQQAGDSGPKRVILGTGDEQTDQVSKVGAGGSAVLARDLVAEELYRLKNPYLDYPKGRTKRAKQARQEAEIAADKILEQIGRDNYKQALDAIHLLLTDPTDDEDKWIDKCDSLHALVTTVRNRVNDLRRDAARRDRAQELTRRSMEARALDPEPRGLVAPLEPPEPLSPDAEAWERAKADMELAMLKATWEQRVKPMEFVSRQDGVFTLAADDSGFEWIESRLKPHLERTLSSVAGEDVTIELVRKDH